jgi:hypothetical protein
MLDSDNGDEEQTAMILLQSQNHPRTSWTMHGSLIPCPISAACTKHVADSASDTSDADSVSYKLHHPALCVPLAVKSLLVHYDSFLMRVSYYLCHQFQSSFDIGSAEAEFMCCLSLEPLSIEHVKYTLMITCFLHQYGFMFMQRKTLRAQHQVFA